ncbi:MAG: ATP-binding cassette domain-containing protein, partial [Anaerolineales bacterium]
MKESPHPLLEMHDVLVKRGKKPVLFVNKLSLFAGEVLAVVGPNGAGKSTLLLTLARLIQPSQGKIFYKDLPIDEWNDLSYRRQISIVFQDPLLVDGSVMDNIILGLRFRGVSRTEAIRAVQPWLSKLNLSDIAKRKVSQLSGGEAHRVSLARALVL